MTGRTLFAVLTSGALLVMLAAQPVWAAEAGTVQSTGTTTKTKALAQKLHQCKASHPA